jgi:MFS family permease
MIAAAALSSITGSSMVGRIAMGISSDWIGRRRALTLSTFLEGIMLLWLMATSSTWSLFLFGIFFGFFYGGHAPQLPALVGETFGLENMGAILGVVTLFWGIGSAIGPFVAGYLVDTTGSYRVGFMIAAAMIFVASAIGLLLKASEDPPVNTSR